MTSQAGIETVQLSDYLKNLENACETPIFGYTHQSLEDEMARQQTIEGSSKWIRESVTSSNHDILNQISYITERVETNKDCLHYLAGITSMEDIYSVSIHHTSY
ncbi:Muc22p, variant 2 [Schistosoma haematobium]|uniref:Muc22p, variant 2 n=1 Tax=Schistosoma haematobium TaxID=6185 RepID=A0A922IQD8_SCHHA|nr:Muc22p, variant 2 [Schistosoma haematobium]KAH9584852.1 Muc22p, variant 2 [Schistosoma haematobium]